MPFIKEIIILSFSAFAYTTLMYVIEQLNEGNYMLPIGIATVFLTSFVYFLKKKSGMEG